MSTRRLRTAVVSHRQNPTGWWARVADSRVSSARARNRLWARDSGMVSRLGALALVVTVLTAACASPPQPSTPQSGGAATEGKSASRVTRITAGLRAELPTVSKTLNTIIPGATALDRLVAAGLSIVDDKGMVRPQLAEAVPTLENGLWKVFPDGRMETTWRIRPGTRWHDGTPLTAEDLQFAVTVGQDRELPLFNTPAYGSFDRIESPDPLTATVFWKQPFIDADRMFGKGPNDEMAVPLPRHVLEKVYLEEKATFTDHPYWTTEFVGSGPYKVREWAKGASVTLVANEHYVLGRPKIDEIEVRFIPDASTLMANVLAGAVDVTIGERNFSLDEVSQVAWPAGNWVPGDRSPIVAFPQLLNPTPPVLTNVQFRRAMLHAIDRQEMANTFQPGLAAVAHAIISVDVREYTEVEGAAVRYEYDPRRTAQLLEGLAYTKGQDSVYVDASGRKLGIETRTTTTTENQKAMLSIADSLQRAGIAAEPHVVPLARTQEGEYRATFPGLEIIRQGRLQMITNVHSARARLAENHFRVTGGFNYTRYLNPEYDALVERYFTTVPWKERMDVLRQMIRHITEQVIIMGMFYSTEANLLSNRMENVLPTRAWNAHEWAVK